MLNGVCQKALLFDGSPSGMIHGLTLALPSAATFVVNSNKYFKTQPHSQDTIRVGLRLYILFIKCVCPSWCGVV